MRLGEDTPGGLAGRISGARLANIGCACCGVGAVANVAYNLLVPVPSIPWAVLPMSIGPFGIALVFPIPTLAVLALPPRQPGSASSLHAFTGRGMNALLTGGMSPLPTPGGTPPALPPALFAPAGLA